MNYLEISGIVFLGVLCLIPLYIVYHLLRAAVLSVDFVRWEYYMVRKRNPNFKPELRAFVYVWWKHFKELFGYNPESSTYTGGDGSVWKGYGTWRR